MSRVFRMKINSYHVLVTDSRENTVFEGALSSEKARPEMEKEQHLLPRRDTESINSTFLSMVEGADSVELLWEKALDKVLEKKQVKRIVAILPIEKPETYTGNHKFYLVIAS